MLKIAFRPALCCLVFAAASLLPSVATGQQGAASFKNFHQYPTGQWQQTTQTYRDGAPAGTPLITTACSGPITPAAAEAIKRMGNSAASQCTMRVVTDTERVAETEQVCPMGGTTQVNHMTMRVVDDKTVTTEIRMTINGREMSESHLTNRYQGTCQPAPMSAMPQMPKPSAEDCKEIAQMKQQASESAKSCTAAPAAERAGCEAAFQRMAKQVEQLSASCR